MNCSYLAAASSVDGHAIGGAVVAFEATEGGGSVSAAADTTDANGRAMTTWTIGTRAGESQRLSVRVVSARPPPSAVTISASATPADAAILHPSIDTISTRVGDVLPAVVVSARDRYGNTASMSGLWITTRLADDNRSLLGTMSARADTLEHDSRILSLRVDRGPQH